MSVFCCSDYYGLVIYEVCPEGIHVIRKIETCIEEDTRYTKHCTQDNDTTVPFKVSNLGLHILLIAISFPIVFSWISSMVWNLFPFKCDFSVGKSQKSQGGFRGAESPGWFDILPKNSAWDAMHEQVCCCDKAAHHQLLTDVDFWIIQIVSTEECSSLTQNLMQICCCTCCHFECDSHTVHMLTQPHLPSPMTTTAKLSLCTHVHSSPLLGF